MVVRGAPLAPHGGELRAVPLAAQGSPTSRRTPLRASGAPKQVLTRKEASSRRTVTPWKQGHYSDTRIYAPANAEAADFR